MTDSFSQYHLVQANFGEWDMSQFSQQRFQEFSNLGGQIMRHIDHGSGFIWAAGTSFYEDENVIRVFDNNAIVLNLSVWRDLVTLKTFVYTSNHLLALKNSRKWFKKLEGKVYALWWIEAGELPTIEMAKSKLDLINTIGSSAEAFDFSYPFDPNGKPC